MSISIRGLAKRFGAFQALHPLDLDIAGGELVALLGPSGCGKTTLLRLIAGLETPDAGEIRFSGEDVGAVPVRARGVGFVFQHYALFRHLTVFENVAFGLRVRPRAERPREPELRATVERMLALVHLEGLARRFPDQLSGGQRQRVALARALVVQPRVLLLDEPFGALDAQVRRELRRWLRRLHDELGITTVFVTHDQDEALDVADRIVVLRAGRVEQAGTAKALYERPATPFVHGFLGETNRLRGELAGDSVHVAGIRLQVPAGMRAEPGSVDVCMRPHDLRISGRSLPGAIAAELVDVRERGLRTRLELAVAGEATPIAADVDPEVAISLTRNACVYFVPLRFDVYPSAGA